MARAALEPSAVSAPRSVCAPLYQRNAWARPCTVVRWPTICPAGLIALAQLLSVRSTERYVSRLITARWSHNTAVGISPAQPTICPAGLIADATDSSDP